MRWLSGQKFRKFSRPPLARKALGAPGHPDTAARADTGRSARSTAFNATSSTNTGTKS